ncbi:MAG: hypothetical protein AB7S68_08235 [Polyangiaceae bacterium]
MSESFRRLIDSVRSDALRTPQRVFEGGRTRHPTLAKYTDAAAVLETLKDDRKHTYPQREALSQALLAEYRKTREHLWANLLMVGYYPALSHLRHRLICDSVDEAELDQLVVVSFFEALRSLKDHECRDRVAMRLSQTTRRRVFAELRAEREQAHAHRDLDAAHLLDLETKREERRNVLHSLEFQFLELVRLARRNGMSQEAAETLATSLFHRRLREMAEEEAEMVGVEDDPAEVHRIYERLKRQRSRALKKVTELVDSVSPV